MKTKTNKSLNVCALFSEISEKVVDTQTQVGI